MSYGRRTPMHDRGQLFFSLFFLVFLTWGMGLVKHNTAEQRVEERWELAPVWEHEAPGGLRSLAAAKDGESTVAVAQWETALRVLGPDGAVRAEREVPAGALVAVADLNGDVATEEILVAASGPASGPVSVQVFDRSLQPLSTAGPAPGLGAPANLAALELNGEPGLEVAVGDARGCVAALAFPGQLWSDCPAGTSALAAGEPRFLGAMQYRGGDHPGDNLVAARGNGGVRVYEPDGTVRWTREIGGGIGRMLVKDLYGDGASEVIFATPGGRFGILDVEGEEDLSLELGAPIGALAVLEWGPGIEPEKIVAGGSDGKIEVRSFDGLPLDPMRSWGGAPVVALLGGDVDGDQRDDLIAGLGTSRVEVFQADNQYLTVPTAEPPLHLAAVGGRLLVGAGNRVQAYQRAERGWPERLRPLLVPILFTLALVLAGLPVVLLHPQREEWRGVDWPRERLPPNWRRKLEGGTKS